MSLVRRVKLFLSLDFKTMLLLLEAFFYLFLARFLVFHRKFSKIAPSLGVQMQESSMQDDGNKAVLAEVHQAIRMAASHTPWESKCLVRAVAGMKMLERRKIGSTLYLGVARDGNGELSAHAWLRSGPYYITGAEIMDQFTVVHTYAKGMNDSVREERL